MQNSVDLSDTKVGDELNLFWHDLWCGEQTLKDVFSVLYKYCMF